MNGTRFRRLQVTQKFVHCRHDVRMRVESAAGKADVRRAVVAKALHQIAASAHHADRQPAAQRLAVGHDIGAHAEILLGSADGETKADKDLVEDQNDISLGAHPAELLEPGCVADPVEMPAPAAVDQRGIAWRGGIRMQRLQRIDQHAGDIAPRADHPQRFLRHIAQCIGLVRGQRISDSRLHIAPPAVIGAAKTHQMRSARVIARKPDGLHHGFGSGHVERDLVQTGDLFQHRDVFEDDRMIGAENWAEIAHPRRGVLDRGLVEVIAEQVRSVRATDVVKAVAVEILDPHAIARLDESGRRQVATDVAPILKWHSIGVGELQVGDAVRRLGGFANCRGKTRPVNVGQAFKSLSPVRRDVGRGAVGAKKPRLVVFVERNQGREAPRHLRVSGDGPMLGIRQFKALTQSRQRASQRCSADPVKRQCGRFPHRIAVYARELTVP